MTPAINSLTLNNSLNVQLGTDIKNPSQHYASRMNIIRFLAMCSIVWGHCLFGIEHRVFYNYNDQLIQSVCLQFGKIGTILFFIISGFFLSDKIKDVNVISYFNYRFFPIIMPWIIFLSALAFIETTETIMLRTGSVTAFDALRLLVIYYNGAIFHAAYWFIPTAVVSAMVLIGFKKYINKSWFGLVLACITLFYATNLHFCWISVNHTKALMAYVFFMWLGIQLKQNISSVKGLLDRFSWPLLASSVLVFFALSCVEGMRLTQAHSQDPFASIRFSNSILSIAIFISLLKSNRLTWAGSAKAKNNSYGVYLVHNILTTQFMLVSNYLMQIHPINSMLSTVATQFFIFGVILAGSYGLSAIIRKSSLSFIIGYNRKKNKPAEIKNEVSEQPYTHEELTKLRIPGMVNAAVHKLSSISEISDSIATIDDQQTISNAPGYWELDIAQKGMFWSRKVTQIADVSELFKPTIELFVKLFKDGEDREKLIEALSFAIYDEQAWELNLNIINAKGQQIEVQITGYPEFKEGKCSKVKGFLQAADQKQSVDIDSEIREFDTYFETLVINSKSSSAAKNILADVDNYLIDCTKQSILGEQYDNTEHFNIEQINNYAGNNKEVFNDVIRLAKKDLIRSAIELENNMEVYNITGLRRIARNIYDTASAVGMPLLSKIAHEFEHNSVITIERVERLFEDTREEIDMVLTIMPN